ASRMFSSLMRPRPESARNTPVNLSVSASSMKAIVDQPQRVPKRGAATAAPTTPRTTIALDARLAGDDSSRCTKSAPLTSSLESKRRQHRLVSSETSPCLLPRKDAHFNLYPVNRQQVVQHRRPA